MGEEEELLNLAGIAIEKAKDAAGWLDITIPHAANRGRGKEGAQTGKASQRAR
jgi:hypothetical protein